MESDMTDPSAYSCTEERAKTDAFVHILEGRK